MKLPKVLINAILILVIVFLIKTIVTFPKDLYAYETVQYKVITVDMNAFEKTLNEYGKEGWKLNSISPFAQTMFFAILER